MNLDAYTTPERLERYALLWSLLRMVVAALSLFFGAIPIAYLLGRGLVGPFLPLFWLVSGVASLYLLYLWNANGRTVFGGSDKNGTIAFFVMVVTGINLGIAGIGSNIGMNLVFTSMPLLAGIIFKVTALVYLIAAYVVWKSWKNNAENLFGGQLAKPADHTGV